ncbi:MAG: sigma-70 family RNA polymerase sigma factor [Prolixibacteraceae bacterium]|jgi:RNA polymerase sigma factor (sigma-70 family)
MQQNFNDNQLWEDFKGDKKDALSQIYQSYVDQLFRYGKKFSTNNDLIKDTIQDLFFDLIRTRLTLGPTNNIHFYLTKAFRRRLAKNMNSSTNETELKNETELQANYIVYSSEDEWIQKESLSKKEEWIRQGLAGLSPKQREILYYRFSCDFDYDQICEIMSMKYDSARKMVFRAIQSLRQHFSDTNLSLLIIFLRNKNIFEKSDFLSPQK